MRLLRRESEGCGVAPHPLQETASACSCSPLEFSSQQLLKNYIVVFSKPHDQFCSRILSSEGLHSVSTVSIFFPSIAAALRGRAAYHHDRLHEESILELVHRTIRPFALTRSNPNLSIISWSGRQASCEVHKLGFEELGACF